MVSSILMPYVAKAISSPTVRSARRAVLGWKEQLMGRSATVDAYINPIDPHSYLLIQVMPDLMQRFNVSFQLFTVRDMATDMFPEPEMWQAWAQRDACQLARLYQLDPPSARQPSETEVVAATQALLAVESQDDRFTKARSILQEFWHGPASSKVERTLSDAQRQQLNHNHQRLRDHGHYQSSMLYYRGEWYWGLDRLDHLEARLLAEGHGATSSDRPHFTKTYADFCRSAPPAVPPATELEVFFSIRSPYSHLGLERAATLAQHYRLRLVVKPVLPMLMRGLAVPQTKKMYIFLDTKREAEKLGIPYGFVADPLGKGVERCYALFDYARKEGKALEYLLSYARGVNAEGIRSETDAGLRRIVERVGLDWKVAMTYLEDDSWRNWAQANLDEMYSLGLWGVPSFRFGNVSAWGQDRLWLIEEAVRKVG